jgi:hypothetical protein
MKKIKIKTGTGRDRHASDSVTLANLEFTSTQMFIAIGEGSPPPPKHACRLWEHTIYELENLAAAFYLAASGELPRSYIVPSPEMLIGPSIHLSPAVVVELGHKGIGRSGPTALFYCYRRESALAKRRLVYADAVLDGRSQQAIFEVESALETSQNLFRCAEVLAPRFVKWDT